MIYREINDRNERILKSITDLDKADEDRDLD